MPVPVAPVLMTGLVRVFPESVCVSVVPTTTPTPCVEVSDSCVVSSVERVYWVWGSPKVR